MNDSPRCPRCGSPLKANSSDCVACSRDATDPTLMISGASGGSPQLDGPEQAALLHELRATLSPRFTIARPLGAGGMGAVYLGFDPLLKRSIAVKLLLPAMASNESARERFLREAEAAASVAHPNVVGVYDVGTLPESGAPYFVMQFVDGVDLATLLAEGHATPEPQAKRVVGEVAAALAAAHARGLVHRDIKPQNVLIERETGRAVVVDFGISAIVGHGPPVGAKPADSATPLTDNYIGTPTYTSPEHAKGLPLSGQSDVYSLGVMAFELVTGHPPFASPSLFGMLQAHVNSTPVPVRTARQDLDPQFAALIDRCLAKAPDARPTAAEITKALIPDAQPSIEWPPPGLEVLRRRGQWVLWTLGVAAAASLLFILLLASQPTADSAKWEGPERSVIWAPLWGAAHGSPGLVKVDDDVPAIWFFLLALAAAATTAGMAAFAVSATRCGLAVRDALRAGYPRTVVFDAATDWWGDTRALRNGTGLFGLAGSALCRGLVRWRRIAAARVIVTLVVVVFTPWLWVAGLLGGWIRAATTVLPSWEVIVLLAPSIILGALVFAARWPEWRLRVRARSIWTLTPGTLLRSTVSARPEVISSWMRVAGEGKRRPSRRGAFAAPIAAVSVAGGLGATAVATCASLVVLFAGVTHDLHEARHAAYEWVDSFRHDQLRFSAIDGLVGRVGSAASRDQRVRAARSRLGAVRGLIASPRLTDLERGEDAAAADARALRRAGTLAHDSAAVHDANQVEAMVGHLREADPNVVSTRDVMSDPEDPRGLTLVADSTLMPAARAYLAFRALPDGYCANAREVIFGVDPRRLYAVRGAAAALRGVGGIDALEKLAEHRLDLLRRSPLVLLPPGNGAPAWLGPIRWLGLSGLHDRLAVCTRLTAGTPAVRM